MAADPQAVAKKARRGIGERRVDSYLDGETHLGILTGRQLAPHRVAAVLDRLDAVAKAAKAAGDDRSMDQLRADTFMDLLTGEGIAAAGPITDGSLGLEGDLGSAEAAQAPWPTKPPPEHRLGGDVDPPEPATPADPEPVRWDELFGPQPPTPGDELDPAEPETAAERARWLADFDRLATRRPATWCVLCGHLTGGPAGPALMPGPRRGVVELVATTDTLMGLADLPAELHGLGPVPADIARQVIAQMNDAQWRYSVYDPMTRMLHHGTTHAPPDEEHETKRRPSAEQAAWVKARDRACVAPGCRRRAQRCDVAQKSDARGGLAGRTQRVAVPA